MHKLHFCKKNISIKDTNVIFHYVKEVFKIFGDIQIKMVYTEGDIHLLNICLMKNLLNEISKRWS